MKKIVVFIICSLLLVISAAPVSAASSVKVTSSKGSVIKLTNGYKAVACAGKKIKKGKTVKVKAISRSSARAKTLYYGISKGWSSAKIAKALKKGRKYKVSVPKSWSFQLVSKGKAKYVAYKVAKKAKPKKQAVKAKQVQVPSKPETAEPKVQLQAEQTPQTGKVDIAVVSSDASYNTSAYALDDVVVFAEGEAASKAVTLDADATGSATLPAGEYNLTVLQDMDSVESVATPYMFDRCKVEVSAGETEEVTLTAAPQPCRLYFYSESEEPLPESVTVEELETGVVTEVATKDSFEISPLEADVPAGNYRITAGEEVFERSLDPGWCSVAL